MISIVSDSTCDLSGEECAALGIGQLAEDLELLQRMCQSAPQRDDEEETTF